MRGIEQLFEYMLMDTPFAEYLFDRITEIRCRMAARFAHSGVDIIRLGDDTTMPFGTPEEVRQTGNKADKRTWA